MQFFSKWIPLAYLFSFIFLACGSGDDSSDDAAAQDVGTTEEDSGIKVCAKQADCLKSSQTMEQNCGANNACFICDSLVCDTLWDLNTAPSSSNCAQDTFNLSWSGSDVSGGCEFDMYFLAKTKVDGTTFTCDDFLSGVISLDDTNVMMHVGPLDWQGKCSKTTPTSASMYLIPATIEFLWIVRVYQSDGVVGTVGPQISEGCKELNCPDPSAGDCYGGYPKGYTRDKDSIYKPGMKLAPSN